jgi:LmbE family N-acetylglucosaminyl deacetylase
MPLSRRSFTRKAASAFAVAGLAPFAPRSQAVAKKMKIVCVGGHPDDPETGCGGTLARMTEEGHEVTVIYLTGGEAGIAGVSHNEAASIRTKEAKAACKILNATPVFAGQIDGDTIVNTEWIKKIDELISAVKPDLVFTHWPIDSHKDHQAASLLTIQSWMRSGKTFELYFFEVCSGSQTAGFRPDTYFDITATREQKRKAVYCHTSQHPDEIYHSSGCNHGLMENFRGQEINAAAAEAFVKMGSTGSHQTFIR